ncbi:hypothetical protein AA958_21110 [Streptomyces sp. CNQ-509]|nr:hypothetical protein AA958_21110 [Streptomyces sp. CNQ-509]
MEVSLRVTKGDHGAVDDREIISYFDGRATFDITISNGRAWDVPKIIDMAYEFGYTFRFVYYGPGIQRLVFERDDGEHGRSRAWWSVAHYRQYGVWGRPQPRVSLPVHMGPRIDPLEAAKARYALGMLRNKAWGLRVSAILAALIAIAVWSFHDRVEVIIPILLVGVPFVLVGALTPWLPSKRLRRHQQTVETFELQQAVERGFIPPPSPHNED